MVILPPFLLSDRIGGEGDISLVVASKNSALISAREVFRPLSRFGTAELAVDERSFQPPGTTAKRCDHPNETT